MIDSVVADEAAATPAEPSIEAAPADLAPDTSAVAETPSAPTPASVADDTLVEVTVNGQPQKMTWAEARKGVMMHAAFTQKTQALATEKQQLAALREQAQSEMQAAQQRSQQVMQILQDPAKLSAVYLALQSQQAQQGQQPQYAAQQPQMDPAAFQQQILNSVVPQAMQAIQFKQQEAAIESDVTAFTSGLIVDDPILSIFPGFTDKVYEEVAKMGPTNTAEAKDYIRAYIDDARAKLQTALGTTQKTAAVAKAKAQSATIPGGSVVHPSAKKYTKLSDMQPDMDAFLDSLT